MVNKVDSSSCYKRDWTALEEQQGDTNVFLRTKPLLSQTNHMVWDGINEDLLKDRVCWGSLPTGSLFLSIPIILSSTSDKFSRVMIWIQDGGIPRQKKFNVDILPDMAPWMVASLLNHQKILFGRGWSICFPS